MSASNECLLNNVLDENFRKMLMPHYLTQKVLCVSKYNIKENFVFPNSKAHRAFNMLAPCLVTYSYFSVSLASSCTLANICPLITNIHYLVRLIVITACVIFQTEAGVLLLIRMQGIDRKLKSFGVTNITYFLVKNWFSVVLILLLYLPSLFTTSLSTDRLSWINYVTWVLLIIMDLDILYNIFIIEFLSSRLKYFSCLFNSDNEILLHLSDQNNLSAKFKNIFAIPKEILQAFTEASRLMQYSVLINIVSTFIDSLLSVQIIIEWTKNLKGPDIYGDPSFTYILAGLWHTKNLVVVIMLSMSCERFYNHVDGVKSVCSTILELYPGKNEYQKTAKNVLRLCEIRHSKMRVCGLFAVDAALPLRLAGLVATYSIVLLQFAFL